MSGLFPQSAAVLLSEPVSLAEIRAVLADFECRVRHDGDSANHPRWMWGDRSVVIPIARELNEHITVDAVDVCWPDGMGNPETELELFGAWSMGYFGSQAFPGNLQRAADFAGMFTWKAGPAAAARHRAFLRIRCTFVLGLGDQALIYPEGYEALKHATNVLNVARALLALPKAVAYFNPNGEVLWDAAGIDGSLAHHTAHSLPALDVWSSIRLYRPNEVPGWCLMDTIGMEQLDVDDMEACYLADRYDGGEVSFFLRNATDYVRKSGPPIRHGDTMDGPGGLRWQARHAEESLLPRHRKTIRWFPLDGSAPPEALLAHTQPLAKPAASHKGLLSWFRRS